MKCAEHLIGIEGLLATFPDANIVVIHRDPEKMVPSLGNLQAAHMNLWREHEIDPEVLGHYCLERYKRVAAQGATLRDRVDPRQYHELTYPQLAAEPIAEVRRLMEHFGYAIHPEAPRRLQDYLDAHPKPKNVYSLGQYGLDQSEVKESLAVYADHLEHGKETP